MEKLLHGKIMWWLNYVMVKWKNVSITVDKLWYGEAARKLLIHIKCI